MDRAVEALAADPTEKIRHDYQKVDGKECIAASGSFLRSAVPFLSEGRFKIDIYLSSHGGRFLSVSSTS